MITAQPDWNDVVRRAVRKRRRVLTLRSVGVAVIALGVAAPAFGLGGWLHALRPGTSVPVSRLAASDLRRLSALTGGATVEAVSPSGKITTVRQTGLRDVRRVTTVRGESFYVIDLTSGRRCYGAGPQQARARFASVFCPAAGGFPSKAEPVLDLSTRVGGRILLAGVAADAVSSVGVLDRSGHLVGQTPVRDNVFVRAGLPLRANGPIVAFDRSGRRIATIGVNGTGCQVTVYLRPDATAAQVSAAIAAVRTTPRAGRVIFVSKAQALTVMRRVYPSLVRELVWNPLPSAIKVTPRPKGAWAGLAKRLRAAHVAGVMTIRSSC
jgi:hypothetical protein